MKILILSHGTGGGHNAAAGALKEEFRSRGHQVTMMEPFELKGKVRGDMTSTFVNQLYIKSVQRIPHVFGFFYSLGEIYNKTVTDGPIMTPVYYWNKNMAKPLYNHIQKEKYDAIVTTHPYPGEMLAAIRNSGHHALPPTFWVSTDYHCIPMTRETNMDNYIIASPDLVPEYVERGIPKEKLYPLGIPVRKEFRTGLTKEQARTALGLEQDKKYFLISGGAVGSGKILEGVTLLAGRYLIDDSVRIIAICGANNFLYRQMKKLFSGKVIMMEHTDRMAEYMIASDVIITKPGGLSSTEAASLCKPLIFISPIPGGLEGSNVKFFQSHEMALYAKSINKHLIKSVEQYQDEAFAEKVSRNQDIYINRDAATDISRLIEQKVEVGRDVCMGDNKSKIALDRKAELERLEAEKAERERQEAERQRLKEEQAAAKVAAKEEARSAKEEAKKARLAQKLAAREAAKQAKAESQTTRRGLFRKAKQETKPEE